jgi:hypothetical protein
MLNGAITTHSYKNEKKLNGDHQFQPFHIKISGMAFSTLHDHIVKKNNVKWRPCNTAITH